MTLSDLQQQWRRPRDPDPVLAASPAWLDRAAWASGADALVQSALSGHGHITDDPSCTAPGFSVEPV